MSEELRAMTAEQQRAPLTQFTMKDGLVVDSRFSAFVDEQVKAMLENPRLLDFIPARHDQDELRRLASMVFSLAAARSA